MQEQIEKIIEEHEELAHAYQEVVQPIGNEDFGEGYWKGIEYSKDFITKAYQQGREDEYKRCVKLLDIDHTKCPRIETCIGYQSALSDLTNNKDENKE